MYEREKRNLYVYRRRHVSLKTIRPIRFLQPMNEKTYSRRSAQLLQQIQTHPHKEELLNIMLQQMTDSNNTYTIPSVKIL